MSGEQIKIGVDSSEAMSSFQRIKSEADALAQSMISNAREQGVSGQNIIKDLETQIQLLERRNKINFESQKVAAEVSRDSGELSEKGFKNQMFDIKMDEKESKLQTQLLKELVETTKINARQGLLSESISNEREDADRDLAAGMAGAALVAAIRTPESDSEGVGADVARKKEDGVGKKIGRGLVTGTEHLFDMMKAPNYYEMMLETGKKVTEVIASTGTPVLSQLAAVAGAGLAYMQDAFSKFLAYEKSAYKMKSINDTMGGGDFTQYGIDKIESAEEYVRVARARGTSENMYNSTMQSYQLQKGYGLDTGSAYSLMNLMRGGNGWTGGGNVTDIAAYAQGSAVESGIAKKGDTAILPEYLNTLISIGRENLRLTGEVDMKQTTKIVNAITHLDDSFKNIEVLTEVFNALQTGLKPASSPQVQALQYSVLSQLKDAQGNAANLSMLQMQEVQTDVNNPYYQQYQELMLKRIKDMSGGNQEMANFTAQGIFSGLSNAPGLTRKVLFGKHTATAGDITSDYSPKSRTGASDIDIQEAKIVNTKIHEGEIVKEKMDKILEGLEATYKKMEELTSVAGDAVKWLKSTNEAVHDNTKANIKIAEEIGTTNSVGANIHYQAATGKGFD